MFINPEIVTNEMAAKKSRRDFLKLVVVGTATMLIAACDRSQRVEPSPTPETMGGVWVTPSPENEAIIHTPTFDLAAQAYPVNHGSPIKDVQFTAHWDGAPSPDPEHNPGGWPILATVTQHDAESIFRATVDLRHVVVGSDIMNIPPGKITLSFDVSNTQGKAKDAPNGEHTITYIPS